MTDADDEGHLIYQDGRPLPALCHCGRGEASGVEPDAALAAVAADFASEFGGTVIAAGEIRDPAPLERLDAYRLLVQQAAPSGMIAPEVAAGILAAAFHVIADKDAEIAELRGVRRKGLSDEEKARRVRGMREVAAPLVGDWPLILAGKAAEIARLQAEIDDLRKVPVEYVPEAGLHAAMTADPDRADGTILRETNGRKRAFEWKAAAKTWEQVQ